MCDALKDAFNNCVINFDRRVNVTDLLQKYELGYEEVHKTLEEHLRQQESKGVKYEKRFLVQGMEKENDTEVYTVVQGEKNLQEFLDRLQQAQARLYSVEIAGGAKSPAYAFKPVESPAITLRSLKVSNPKTKFQPAPLTNGSTTSSAAEKVDAKPSTKKTPCMNIFAKQSVASPSTRKTNGSKEDTTAEKKSSPLKKPSPDTKKPSPTENKQKKNAVAALPYKKGINNFFGAAAKAVPKKEEVKKEPKSNSPQKQTDLLKKQASKTKAKKLEEEPSTSKKKKSPPKSNAPVKANTSVQLFSDDTSDSSSDEGKKPLACNDEKKNPSDYVPIPEATGYKRNRITDSDEEDAEEPPNKVEKIESSSEPDIVDINEDDVPVKSETFLDEEGFVITIKPKKTNAAIKGTSKKSTKARSPRKTPTKTQATKTQTSSKPAAAAPAKTKQVNIMNFFGKK